MQRACQPWASRVRAYRGKCEEVGLGTERWNIGSSSGVRQRAGKHIIGSPASLPIRGAPSTISEEDTANDDVAPSVSPSSPRVGRRYISPTDLQYQAEQRRRGPDVTVDTENLPSPNGYTSDASGSSGSGSSGEEDGADLDLTPSPAPSSPEQPLNPPTPHHTDIHLREFYSAPPPGAPSQSSSSHRRGHSRTHSRNRSTASTGASQSQSRSSRLSAAAGSSPIEPTTPGGSVLPPPDYTIVDPHRYPNGFAVDIPEEILANALREPMRGAGSGSTGT